MEFQFLEKILGKDFTTKLKGELEKIQGAWQAHEVKTDNNHKEVMAFVEPVAKALESISTRLEAIEKALPNKNSNGQGGV